MRKLESLNERVGHLCYIRAVLFSSFKLSTNLLTLRGIFMKKTVIAAGVVVALAGAVTSAAWFTGQKAEAQLQHVIELNNQIAQKQLTGTDLTLNVENMRFERGVFSSDTQYEVVLADKKQNREIARVPFTGKLFHGPLPLNQLQKFNFKPLMFSLESNAEEIKVAAAQIAGLESVEIKNLISTTNVDYVTNGTVSATIEQILVGLEDDGQDMQKDLLITLKDSKVDGTFDKDGNTSAKTHFASLQVEDRSPARNKAVLTNVDSDINFATIEGWENLFNGKLSVKAESIEISDALTNKEGSLIMTGLKGSFSGEKNGEFVDINSDFSWDKVGKSFDKLIDVKFQSALKFAHIDGAALNELIAIYNIDGQLNERGGALFKAIQQKQLQVVFDAELSNSQGKNNLAIDFTSSNSAVNKGKLLAIEKFKANASIDKQAAQSIFADWQVMFGDLNLDAENAKRMAADAIANYVQQGILVDGEKTATAKLELKEGEFFLNDTQKIPEDQLMLVIFLVFMGMGMH